MTKYEFHPIANKFPLLPKAQLQTLADDIKANGLHEPVWLYDGKILDGRNRYLACDLVGVDPVFREYKGDSPFAFVVSLNLYRRHLTRDQRMGYALKFRPELKKEAEKRMLTGKANPPTESVVGWDGQSSTATAQQFEVGREALEEMIAEEKENPELADALIDGKTTVKEEKKKRRKKKQKRREAAAIEKTKDIPKLWRLTDCQDVIPCVALITDPPYGILDEPWEPKELRKFTVDWARRWNKCGADFLCIFWSQRFLWDGRQWFDGAFSKYDFHQLLIWHYANNKSPQSRMGFKQTWEPVFFYRRKDSTKQIMVAGESWGDGLNDFDCHVAAVPQSNFSGQETKVHPAQKPVSVFRWLINATTQPGEIVCDPFCGSGTSGIAASQLKRQFVGIEKDPEFLGIANERIAAYGI